MDHGLYSGPMAGIESPVRIARQVIPGSDGLLISPGFARALTGEIPSRCALVLRIGALTDDSTVQNYEAVFATVETALRYDADAVVHSLYLGTEHDQDAIRDAGAIVDSADRYQVPVLLEFLPAGDTWTAEQVARWARLGFELGGSAVKTVYTGDPESFRQVVGGCPIPILIAGGPAVGTTSDLLGAVAGAMKAGAAGTAIGRRIWQTPGPSRLLEAMAGIVHGSMSVEEALAVFGAQAASAKGGRSERNG
jgi:fructose-bisphosphate aldolase/2-amino-3,7-dideoxy-D-threo-hept-6-ulosonate synthase